MRLACPALLRRLRLGRVAALVIILALGESRQAHNASRRRHAELDESTAHDVGAPGELAAQYAQLKRRLPELTLMGGCCGTDHRHLERIAEACVPLFRAGA